MENKNPNKCNYIDFWKKFVLNVFFPSDKIREFHGYPDKTKIIGMSLDTVVSPLIRLQNWLSREGPETNLAQNLDVDSRFDTKFIYLSIQLFSLRESRRKQNIFCKLRDKLSYLLQIRMVGQSDHIGGRQTFKTQLRFKYDENRSDIIGFQLKFLQRVSYQNGATKINVHGPFVPCRSSWSFRTSSTPFQLPVLFLVRL